MYKSIYVPVDNSDHSNRAVACSLALGKAFSAKLVGCHVKIVSSGAKRKPNPTGGAEGSEISGLPKAGERTKTQRFKQKGVLEGLHKEIGGLQGHLAVLQTFL